MNERTQEARAVLLELQRNLGAPLREIDDLLALPAESRWIAVRKNQIFSDHLIHECFASTAEQVMDLASAQSMRRPDLFVVCESCGKRLLVVNVENASKILSKHQSTIKHLWRAIVLAMVWMGFIPIEQSGADSSPSSDVLLTSRSANEALATFRGPSQERSSRLWAPLPRVLALVNERRRRLLARSDSSEQPMRQAIAMGFASALVHRAESMEFSEEDFDQFEDPEVIARWTQPALDWSAEFVHHRANEFKIAADVHAWFAARLYERVQPDTD